MYAEAFELLVKQSFDGGTPLIHAGQDLKGLIQQLVAEL